MATRRALVTVYDWNANGATIADIIRTIIQRPLIFRRRNLTAALDRVLKQPPPNR